MKILCILCLFAFLNLCCAQEIPCNVTQSSQGTVYSVPEFQALDCYYHWVNESGHVLANNKGKIDDLVLNSSAKSVTTHMCAPQLNYTRDCISEGTQRTTYCVTDCTTPEPRQSESKEQKMHRHYWSTIVSFFITALLVVLVMGSICSNRRNNTPSADNAEARLN